MDWILKLFEKISVRFLMNLSVSTSGRIENNPEIWKPYKKTVEIIPKKSSNFCFKTF